MKKVFLLTVPGTGTRFTKNYLAALGYHFVDAIRFRDDTGQLAFFQHAAGTEFDLLYDMFPAGQAAVVSTLRDPYKAYLSGIERPHIRHGRHAVPVGMQQDKAPGNSIKQWDAMIAAHERLDADGVSIAYMDVEETSVPDRMDMLTAIADHLQVTVSGEMISELAQTWVPVGKSGPNAKREEYRDHGTIDGQVPTALDFAVAHVQGLR